MLLILALLAHPAWAQTASIVVENARIYTVNRAQPTASAIAVSGDRILAVGDDVKRYIGPATRRIDARGATLLPGFIDSHGHMAGLGESLESLDLTQTRSILEVQQAVASANAAPGDWIRGRGWDQTRWPGGGFPTAGALASGNPVFLTRVDGHAAWVNRKALEIADINAATKDPEGGRILRDSSGRPTGVLVDRAMGLVSRHIPAPSDAQVLRRIRRAAQECAKSGLTTVHDAGVNAQHIAAYRALIASGDLPVRVYAMIGGDGPLWQEQLRKGPEIGDFLTIRSIKLMSDGALGSRGAAMKEPYSDELSNRGLLILKRAEIERIARQAAGRGFQVNTHAIGDRANREVLDGYSAALSPGNGLRFRIEHAQIVSLADIPAFQRLGVIASMQATHATSDMRWAEQRVGPARIDGAYAWQRFRKAGVRIANGSDFPVENVNPLWGFYASITRQDLRGWPDNGWLPGQRLSRQEALESWTIDGAFAAFEEKRKGSLEPGKLADFILLSADILEIPARQIPNTRVILTVVGGKLVYQEKG